MAIGHGQLIVTDVRVLVVHSDYDGQHVQLVNIGTEPMYIGNGDVTSENGYKLCEEIKVLGLFLGPGEELYAIMAEDETSTIAYIASMNQ